MNALYDIFAGINIFDCISFQHDEESDHGKLRCAAESVPAGRDNYVLSTGQGAEGEDQLTEEEAGAPRTASAPHLRMPLTPLRCSDR